MTDTRRLPWMSGLVVAFVGAAWYIAVVVMSTVGIVEQPLDLPPEPVSVAQIAR